MKDNQPRNSQEMKEIRQRLDEIIRRLDKLERHPVFAMVTDGLIIYKIKIIMKMVPYILVLMGATALIGWMIGTGRISW